MDLMYLPDAIAYPTLRSSPTMYSYEPDAPLWTRETGQQTQPQQKAPQENKRGSHGGSCPLCKERQRRRLASYIRSKSRQDSESAIEEEEEAEEQEKQGSAKKTTN